MGLGKLLAVFVAVALLLWLWPNLVHEPLHALALQLQGTEYQIAFHWGWPAHPTITRLGEVEGVAGGMLFLLLPSLASVVLLLVLFWSARVQRVTLLTHVSMPAYLAFDLIVNMLKWRGNISDFHFLAALPVPDFLALGASALVAWLAFSVVWRAAPIVIYNRVAQPCVSSDGG